MRRARKSRVMTKTIKEPAKNMANDGSARQATLKTTGDKEGESKEEKKNGLKERKRKERAKKEKAAELRKAAATDPLGRRKKQEELVEARREKLPVEETRRQAEDQKVIADMPRTSRPSRQASFEIKRRAEDGQAKFAPSL